MKENELAFQEDEREEDNEKEQSDLLQKLTEEPLKDENTKTSESIQNLKRKQSKIYADNEEPTLLRFNTMEPDDDVDRKDSNFVYNKEEDIFKIKSKKSDKGDKKSGLNLKKSLGDSFDEKFGPSNKSTKLEKIDESEEIEKEKKKAKKKKKKKKDKNIDDTDRSLINVSNVESRKKRLYPLYIGSISYLIFSVIELISGYYSNSITLMADAAHYFSEFTCYFIYIISFSSKKNVNSDISFGYYKEEILGVLVGASFLWGFSFWLLYYAVKRFLVPQNVSGLTIIIFGVASAFFNLLMGFLLMYFGKSAGATSSDIEKTCSNELKNESMKLSFKQLLFRGLQSCLIILAGVIIYFLPTYLYIDPISSLILIAFLLIDAYSQLEDSIKILMGSSPVKINIEDLKEDLMGIDGVSQVNNIHVWNLRIGEIAMSCHLTTSLPQTTLSDARELIKNKYNIIHSTIQIELEGEKKMTHEY